MVNPASAIGGPLLVGKPNAYSSDVVGARRSIVFEYVASDCHVVTEFVSFPGHIPPKTYMLVCEALPYTNVEKVMDRDKKRARDVSGPPLVSSCFQTPLPVVLFTSGESRHNWGAVEVHEPVYTVKSPNDEMAGVYGVDSSD